MKSKWNWPVQPLALMALAIGLTVGSGCDDPSTSPAGSARLSVVLTDAAGDVAEAWVNIDGIYLQGGALGGDGEDFAGNSFGPAHGNTFRHSEGDGEEGNGRVWLREDPTGWINLLTLSDDVEEIVAGAVVPAGFYKQLRFIIEDAAIVTEGGLAFATPGADLDGLNAVREGDPLNRDGLLNCPGCDRSGLKVMCRDGIVALQDGETILVTDFDVGQSFGRERGHSNRWVMHPLIRCASMPLVGEIAGTVKLAENVELPAVCGDNEISLRIFTPLAADTEEEVWTGHTSQSGDFKIRPLPAGMYQLGYEPEIDFEDGSLVRFSASADPASVEVETGGTAHSDYTIDELTCSPGDGS